MCIRDSIPAIRGRAEFSFWGKEGLPIDQVRPMYAVTDDLRKPIVHIGVAAQWNPRTVGNLPDLIKETDVGVAADFAGSYLGIELQAAVLYVKTTRDTLSAIPPLERFGWWAHLRYTCLLYTSQGKPVVSPSTSVPTRFRLKRAMSCSWIRQATKRLPRCVPVVPKSRTSWFWLSLIHIYKRPCLRSSGPLPHPRYLSV